MERVEQIREGKGVATVLAIGTSNPPNFILQADYPDFYFRVTNSDHLHRLKQKFKSICMFLISPSHPLTYIFLE
ncbi:2,4,6-trihydroxybenzophenone synthase [Spatholobus suberectus]|nr:2,4,6-trihydroxybenzophenone synthase [Spatholobus suberectus]